IASSAPGYSQYMPDPSRKTRPLRRMSLRWAHTCRRRSPAACSLKYRAKSIRVYLSFARSPCPILLNALARIWSLRALLPSLVSITSTGFAGALGAACAFFSEGRGLAEPGRGLLIVSPPDSGPTEGPPCWVSATDRLTGVSD